MSRGAVLVWLALWRDTKADGMACASIGNLAGRIRGSRNTVCRALSSLESRGLVEVVRRGSVNGGATVYRVLEGA
jgi:DNA-binding transcriptional regulator YhcF (GntR family)